MITEKIKKEYIKFMEETHSDLLYPKNYIGVLMAVFIEQAPITQDRIKELTGYSITTISQNLKLILSNHQVDRIKEPKIRKKFYTISVSPRMLMFVFFKSIIESYEDKVDFILPLIEEVSAYVQKHEKFLNFQNFLKKLHEMSEVYMKLHTDSKQELKDLIMTGQTNGITLLDHSLLETPEYLDHLQKLVQQPQIPQEVLSQPFQTEELLKSYNQLKDKFYQKFQANLTTTQLMSARTVIGTELLLENRPITQAEIETTTNYARSLISDVLNLLLNYKMVRLIKKPGDNKKYYMINQSWETRLLNRLTISKRYAFNVSQRISKMIIQLKRDKSSDEKKELLDILSHIQHSFIQFEQYYKFMEMRYIKR